VSIPSQRIQYLDALRAAAIFLVLGAHMYAFPLWKDAGWIGVDLFFVLSGFLVSGLLFSEFVKHGRISVGRFFVRRAFKIYPAFICMLTATLLIEVCRGSPISPSKWLAEVFFVQNYFPSVYGHTWSLAVEVHFYLVLAFFLLWASQRDSSDTDPFRVIVPAAVAVSLAALALRVATAAYSRAGAFNVRDYMCPAHLRLDSFMTGVLISYWYHFHNYRFLDFARRRRWAILSTSCLLLAPVVVLGAANTFVYTAGYTCLYLGFGGILVYCLGLPPRGSAGPVPLRLAAAAVGSVGFYSYGIYLWHLLVQSLGVSAVRRIFHGPFTYTLSGNFMRPLRYIEDCRRS